MLLAGGALAIAGAAVLSLTPWRGAAVAQDATAPIEETFEDWTLRCTAPAEGGGPERACAVTLEMTGTDAEGHSGTILSATMTRQGEDGAVLTLVTPLGTNLQAGVTVSVGPGSAVAPYLTCQAGGCIVQQAADASVIEALKGGEAIRLNIPLANGQALEAALSMAGFAAAWDRLGTL